MNYLTDMTETTAGIYGVLPRYKIPQPIVQQIPLSFHNIKVDNSIIGSINTGEMQRIDIAMDCLKNQGQEELIKALREFTETVLAETRIDVELKNQIIEQIPFLASQSILSQEKQKFGIVKAVLSTLKDTVSTVATLTLL